LIKRLRNSYKTEIARLDIQTAVDGGGEGGDAESLPDFQIRVPESLRALPSLILINQSDLGYCDKNPFQMR